MQLEASSLGRIAHTVKIDPDLNASITTRADHTMCIKYPTGDSLVLWPDGSRTTSRSDGTWVVEAEGLPCVRGGPDSMSCQVAMHASMTWHAKDTAIDIQHDVGDIIVAAKGIVSSCAFPIDPQST